MTKSMTKLPRDLFRVPANNRIARYAEMEAACRESLAQRIDLTFQFFQEIGDPKGWIEEIQKRFEATGATPPATKSLRDNIKIFQVLRMPPPAGLGITLRQASVYSYGRMRVLAQNKDWTLANVDRAKAFLEDPNASEPKMRQLIREETGKAEPADTTPVLRLRLPEKKLAAVAKAINDVATELEKAGKKVPENRDELLVNIISEWRQFKRDAAKRG